MAKSNLSFLENEEEVVKVAPKKRYIIKSVIIDKFTIKKQRIELTPSVCDVCATDLAAINKFGSWERVPDEAKPTILKALQAHKDQIHTTAEQLIVDEDQLPKQWLGNRAGV